MVKISTFGKVVFTDVSDWAKVLAGGLSGGIVVDRVDEWMYLLFCSSFSRIEIESEEVLVG